MVFSVSVAVLLVRRNMMAIGSNVAFIGLMAAAGTPLIIAGGLDLSVAAVAGLSGVVIALLYTRAVDSGAAAVAVADRCPRSAWSTALLADAAPAQSADRDARHDGDRFGHGADPHRRPHQAADGAGFNWIGSAMSGGSRCRSILMIVSFLALSVVLRRTRFGRFVYATGGNAEASRLIGLPVDRVQISLYVLSGISGAVAGTMLAAMLGAAAPNAAAPHLLTVIAAIILGGTSLYGGRGSVGGRCSPCSSSAPSTTA